ncbi:hypothetical protein [Derxia gummosa]|uniref:Uncharacterized protein n=1 Tax=Derxia gummosa DSM 723 TaxID=1121388 RepID=A0A8B6XBU8_9BURK|nr:hypothetical protein [Derxia gummosa]
MIKPKSLRSIRRLLVWMLIVLSDVRSAAIARAADPGDFNESACLVVKFVQGQPERDMPMLHDLGVHWARELVRWHEFEPQPGNYAELSPVLKRQLAYYRSHDIGLIALLTLDNPVAYPPGLDGSLRAFDAKAYGRFAHAAAEALSREGVRFVLEIGNEPHNSALLPRLGGQWNGSPPSPWLQHYVAMANAAVATVKQWNPAIKLLAQDDMWLLHYRFIDAGLTPEIDGLSVHPYVMGMPERAAVAHDTDWARPYQLVDPDRAFGSAVRRLKAYGRQKLGRDLEIWITEWGWPADGTSPAFTSREVANFLPRAFLLANEAGVQATCWFSSQDNADGPMGLTTNFGRRRLAYDSYRIMTKQLAGMHFERRISGPTDRVLGVHVLRYSGDGGFARTVAWNSSAEPASLRLTGEGTAMNAEGDELKPIVLGEGAACVPLGPGVIYLSGGWADSSRQTLSQGDPECRAAR